MPAPSVLALSLIRLAGHCCSLISTQGKMRRRVCPQGHKPARQDVSACVFLVDHLPASSTWMKGKAPAGPSRLPGLLVSNV